MNEDGAYGCFITPLVPMDPRIQSSLTIVMSEDCLYRPPCKHGTAPVRINHVLYKLSPSVVTDWSDRNVGYLPNALVDDDSSHLASGAVADVLTAPAMGQYSYVHPLSGSPDDLAILQSRFGGASGRAISKTLAQGFGGSLILDSKGTVALASFLLPSRIQHRI